MEYRLYRGNNSFDVGIVHGGKERQGNNLPTNALCDRKHSFPEAALAVKGKQVDRGVMKSHADFKIQHALHECRTANAIRQDEMKHMPIALIEIGNRQFCSILGFEIGTKTIEIMLRERQSPCVECCKMAHLGEAKSAADLRHIVFSA